MTKHLAPCGAEFDTAEDARSHELLCDQCAGATERTCAHCGAHVSEEGPGVWLDAMDDAHCDKSASGHHEAEVEGCSCGMADRGAPGHDGHESGVTRYLLVELDLPDGSGHDDADPEAEHTRIREAVAKSLAYDIDLPGNATVTDVYPGDVVACDDLPDDEPGIDGHEGDELREAVRDAARAAHGDSNDDEIDALRNALDLALIALGTSWDTITDGMDDDED